MTYLSESDDKKSSMRLGWILTAITSTILLLADAAYIIIKALKCDCTIDWSGMGVFVFGILAGLSGLGFAKAFQKGKENGKHN